MYNRVLDRHSDISLVTALTHQTPMWHTDPVIHKATGSHDVGGSRCHHTVYPTDRCPTPRLASDTTRPRGLPPRLCSRAPQSCLGLQPLRLSGKRMAVASLAAQRMAHQLISSSASTSSFLFFSHNFHSYLVNASCRFTSNGCPSSLRQSRHTNVTLATTGNLVHTLLPPARLDQLPILLPWIYHITLPSRLS